MKNILLLTIISFGFIACNSSTSTKNSTPITVSCDSPKSSYQVLQSGDIISKAETLYKDTSVAPMVKIVHREDGLKTVCINSGTAVILR